MITNVLTIDVEDWYHGLVPIAKWRECEDRIVDSTRRILDIVDEAGARSTFFILGDVADLHPELVQEIAARGHEVATHGYHHELVYRLTPEAFEQDVARSLASLRAAVTAPVVAYRAPFFSIVRVTLGTRCAGIVGVALRFQRLPRAQLSLRHSQRAP